VTVLDGLHDRHVLGRRVEILSTHVAALLPPEARVLDVGCGDGRMARAVAQRRPDVAIEGIDVLVRSEAAIPVAPFDGARIPLADASVDAVLFIDVLHHTPDPGVLIAEAARVARRTVIIKDHLADGLLAEATLRFMDRVGNARHGVALPYTYWRRRQWRAAFEGSGLTVEVWRERLALYPAPASLVFDRSLHLLTRLRPPAARTRTP
jgi:SAM-dependent methyltransferase